MAYSTLITGPERRRAYSEEQKVAVLAAAFAPGASVAAVARQVEIHTSLIYRWRRAYLAAEAGSGFAPAVVVDAPGSCSQGPARAEPAMVVELGKVRVRIASTAPAALVTAALRALR